MSENVLTDNSNNLDSENRISTSAITDTAGTDCLLIVDADTAGVQMLNSTLGKLGFEILQAVSGKEALQLLKNRCPDLILLDLCLPDMDGFEICRRIQDNPDWLEVPIIFFSETDDKDLVVRALESGGVDYITKPFHKQELLSRVRTQLMLKTSRDYAKRLAQDKDEMLSMISHHLQNHMVGMHMSAQFFLERMPAGSDPKLRTLAENIRTSSGQMRAFVKSFLANAAADHGLQLRMEGLSLSDAAIRAVKQFEDPAHAKNIALRVDLPDGGASVWADSSGLTQVLDNLLSNAVKFSPSGSEVIISVTGGPTYWECSVKDQGAGFTEDDKLKMFRRYARLSAQPTGGEPSTGLGLSIAKKLVRAMNGDLVCESKPGEGTTFILRLPQFGN